MNRIVIKTLIAIAVGMTTSQIAGNLKPIERYFMLGKSKQEISEENYKSRGQNHPHIIVENRFNKTDGYLYGSAVGSILLIILLRPELKRNE